MVHGEPGPPGAEMAPEQIAYLEALIAAEDFPGAHLEIGTLLEGLADIEGPSESVVHVLEGHHESVTSVLDFPTLPSEQRLPNDQVVFR